MAAGALDQQQFAACGQAMGCSGYRADIKLDILLFCRDMRRNGQIERKWVYLVDEVILAT